MASLRLLIVSAPLTIEWLRMIGYSNRQLKGDKFDVAARTATGVSADSQVFESVITQRLNDSLNLADCPCCAPSAHASGPSGECIRGLGGRLPAVRLIRGFPPPAGIR